MDFLSVFANQDVFNGFKFGLCFTLATPILFSGIDIVVEIFVSFIKNLINKVSH